MDPQSENRKQFLLIQLQIQDRLRPVSNTAQSGEVFVIKILIIYSAGI
jgi:hypothetical protein